MVLNIAPLTEEAIRGLLKELCDDFNFDEIDDYLPKDIMVKSQGNPMVATSLINFMMAENEILVVAGTLKAKMPSNRNITSALQIAATNDATRSIVAQFDKLSTLMKQFLRVAAIAGQHFKISEVLAVLKQSLDKDSDMDDKFKFIYFPKEKVQIKLLASDEYDNNNDEEIESEYKAESSAVEELQFAHYLIQQGILSSMMPSQQESLHKEFAQMYETLISTGYDVLSYRQLLVYHLMKTNGDNKRKQKNIYRAFVDFAERFQTAEALEFYEMLENFPDRLPQTLFEEMQVARLLSGLYFEQQ
ncbi:hypothetical protein HK100_002152 [Physocladia obscura]|uniref:Uncharacterized protein n=1 Tax=Physocladia obscura TaxID=109957 RepID=A0AAD5T7B6_9FUNG|nr:hypothetical protein HK100_002152 [Physocladia obscura]